MKLSYLWLKEFVDFDLTPEELAHTLRGLGFDLAALIKPGGDVKNVVTAKVESREKHPNADKLSVCRVFDGKETFTVVCGAPNVAAGQTVPLARVGAVLPNGLKIEKAVIRGQESQGMLCSERELGLSGDHSGILVLLSDTPLGEDIAKTLHLDDAFLDVEVTPNRPDVLSHWGMAREIAATLGKKVRLPDVKIPKAPRRKDLVKVEEPALCPRYVGRVLEGVEVRPSPLWMQRRLEGCGIRAINNLVDVTNYVLLELGHPLHVFDIQNLDGGRVVVRLSKPGESLLCLDGAARNLKEALVVADESTPAALAGVMGGQLSAVGAATRNILLESALFNPSHIRRSRNVHGLSTESSYRFERGTDGTLMDLAGRRAVHLILASAGGRLTGEQDVHSKISKPIAVSVNVDGINRLLGVSLSSAEMRKHLEKLDFAVYGKGKNLKVVPPPHRHDVREESDVAEEVVRMTGYAAVPARRRPSRQEPETLSRERRMLESARSLLLGHGFWEAKNYGLSSRDAYEKFLGATGASAVELDNPLSISGEILSPTLLVQLLANLQTNLRRGTPLVRLFESARVFSRGENGVRESSSLAWVAAGETHRDHWRFKARPLEIWDAKTWMKSLLKEWKVAGLRFAKSTETPFLHPSESQAVFIGDKSVGFFGKIHPRRADALDAPRETFLGELNLSHLAGERFLESSYQGLPKHPALVRDFSLLFPQDAAWSSIALSLHRLSPLVEEVDIFDVFTGSGLSAGGDAEISARAAGRKLDISAKSLAFRVHFRHSERTLTDAEAADLQSKIIAHLQSEFKAVPRVDPSSN